MAELWGLEGSVSFFMRRTVHELIFHKRCSGNYLILAKK